ncbi:MAG: hypothetical protein JSR73_15325 [Proteobacteria bacterium]|nr:hypothetical protein [Pseudomonadota bacterium]
MALAAVPAAFAADPPASSTASAQAPSAATAAAPASVGVAPPVKKAPDARAAGATPPHYRPDRFAGRAAKYYWTMWGIDSLSVKLMESGELIRFSYRVIDPARAKVLNEKRNEASLIDPKAGVSLVVPTLEKVGQLRQSPTPEAGKSYWMAFSNRGRVVKRGDRVDVLIGTFQAKNLVVD